MKRYMFCLKNDDKNNITICFSRRHLEHSTIIYEDPQHSPLLRLSWNKQDPNYLATFSLDAMEVCLQYMYIIQMLEEMDAH